MRRDVVVLASLDDDEGSEARYWADRSVEERITAVEIPHDRAPLRGAAPRLGHAFVGEQRRR
ncbi:hypothetical protein L6R52_23455 [Myxococcota bacterium]|nr:hypothetical protein [Myxococcota bacterium]